MVEGIPKKYVSILGLAMVLGVFLVAVYFAASYPRFTLPPDPASGINALVSETIYLLARLAFLSLALAAGVHMMRVGFSKGES